VIQIFRPVTNLKMRQGSLLGGRIAFRQPEQGYRSAIDPIFLAAAVTANTGEAIMDAGSGAGAAALCLVHRVQGCTVTAIEIQHELVLLLDKNIKANKFTNQIKVLETDLVLATDGPPFDHAMANPPFYSAGSGTRSPLPSKATSNQESSTTLSGWVKAMLNRLKHKGVFTMIMPSDRVSEVLAVLHENAGDIRVFPLWPKQGHPAKRVIVRARRGLKSPSMILPGLVLHQENGKYTKEASQVLQDGEALNWSS
jgi:tRNA1(Val) A37 N6-methylase TrmN6